MNKGDLVGAANKNVDLEKDIFILFDPYILSLQSRLTHIIAAERERGRERATRICNN